MLGLGQQLSLDLILAEGQTLTHYLRLEILSPWRCYGLPEGSWRVGYRMKVSQTFKDQLFGA